MRATSSVSSADNRNWPAAMTSPAVPACSVISAAASRPAISRDASSPKIASGLASGVTKCRSTLAPVEYARSASISASS